jgi:hypothetical protein
MSVPTPLHNELKEIDEIKIDVKRGIGNRSSPFVAGTHVSGRPRDCIALVGEIRCQTPAAKAVRPKT